MLPCFRRSPYVIVFLTHRYIYVDRSLDFRSPAVFPIIWMSYHRYTSTGPPQQPARSILKPSRSSHPTSASLSSGSLPAVKVRDPPIPTQASQRAVQSLQDVPLEGPIPAIYFPPTQNRQQLLTLLHQFTTQLEADGAGKDLDCKREKISRPQAGRPTYQADGFPEFRMILMGPWAPGPCCELFSSLIRSTF